MSEADDDDGTAAGKPGTPAWVMTFADLMSLLMCFFVLLLSFSEMDLQKFKQLAGSMAEAFGVQNQIKVKDIPKGTSIIAQEFSPGRPNPTPLNEVRQSTTDFTKSALDVKKQAEKSHEGERSQDNQGSMSTDHNENVGAEGRQAITEAEREAARAAAKKIEENVKKLSETLKDQIESGQVQVETHGNKIIIRVKEHGSFPSGSATLSPEFVPIMDKMREVLKTMNGRFFIEGHSDDIPISTPRFRSNWELSSARAVSVAHELFKSGEMDQSRFTIVGKADTQPLKPNKNWESRATNRRVEIIVEPEPLDKLGNAQTYDPKQFLKKVPDLNKTPKEMKSKPQSLETPKEANKKEPQKKELQKKPQEKPREKPDVFEFHPDEIF